MSTGIKMIKFQRAHSRAVRGKATQYLSYSTEMFLRGVIKQDQYVNGEARLRVSTTKFKGAVEVKHEGNDLWTAPGTSFALFSMCTYGVRQVLGLKGRVPKRLYFKVVTPKKAQQVTK